MLGEMVKKWGRAMFYISCNSYFLEKILLVDLKNLYTSACLNLNYVMALYTSVCLNLNYGKVKQEPKWSDLSKRLTNNLTSLILVIFNLKFRSIFNLSFTNHSCLHCAILKPLSSC